MASLDDTQPTRPVRVEGQEQGARQPVVPTHQSDPFAAARRYDLPEGSPYEQPPYEDEPPASGPGCIVWGLMVVFALIMAVVIVILAGTAGWAEGHRIADDHATATQVEEIAVQLRYIPTDVASGNQYLLSARLGFLATMTPGVPAVPQIAATATALYFNSQPTAIPTEMPTVAVVATETALPTDEASGGAPTADAAAQTGNVVSGYNLDDLFEDAQLSIRFNEYADAVETLDLIIRLDPDYQRATVRDMMFQSLTAQAEQLYHTTDTLAEAIALTDQAEQYGSLANSDLTYERLIAEQYLDIVRLVDLADHARAITALNYVISNFQSTYKGIDLKQMLFNEYVAYGDAWGFGGQFCQAVTQYNLALNYFSSGSVQAKRDAARTTCEQGTPTPPPDGGGTGATGGNGAP